MILFCKLLLFTNLIRSFKYAEGMHIFQVYFIISFPLLLFTRHYGSHVHHNLPSPIQLD